MQMIDVHIPTTDARTVTLTRRTEPEPELKLPPKIEARAAVTAPTQNRCQTGTATQALVVQNFHIQTKQNQSLASKLCESAKIG